MTRSKLTSKETALVVKDAIERTEPMILASGSEAVAALAGQLQRLLPAQRAFLRLRFYHDNDAACARTLALSPRTVQSWKDKDANFVTAYNDLFTQPLLHARAEMLLLVPKAIHKLGELVDHPNPQVSQAAIDRVLKGRDAQMVSNNVKVEGGDNDLYDALMSRLAGRKARPLTAPAPGAPADEPPIEGSFTIIPPEPDTEKTAEHEKTT